MTRTKINDYKYFQEITTRWNDNDVRWHVNNAKYYEFFDTIINKYLIGLETFDLKTDKNFFVTAETSCKYFEEISFPDSITAGLKINYIGNSSIKYEIGLFKNENKTVSAIGIFVHILINSITKRPVKIPVRIIKHLDALKD